MQALELETHSSSRLTIDNFTTTSEDQYDLLARFNDRSKTLSINFREILVNEVLTSMQIDLAEDLLHVIDLYMYGKNHCFVFHERQSQDLQVLSLSPNILESLTPCNPNVYSKTEDSVIQILVGRKLFGFDMCDDHNAEYGDPNPLEIITDKDSIFLVPDKPANWWLNRDSKFMNLPALYGFNHRIEDARIITRTTGPYLQLLVSRCDHGGFRKCSNWSNSSSCVSDECKSTSEDSITMEFFSCCESSKENTMVFLSPRMTVLTLEESHGPVSQHSNRIHSREITPELTIDDLDNDVPTKTHVLELGAGLLRKNDSYKSFRYQRPTPNPKYSVCNTDFCNKFDALASL